MRAHLLLWFVILLPVALAAQQSKIERSFALPESAANSLTCACGSWAYADIAIPKYDRHKGKRIGQEYADLIGGDFNGDGVEDYAGIFSLKDSTDTPLFLIVLLSDGSAFKCHILDQGDSSIPTIVRLIRRGTTQKDLSTGRKYTYAYDAIGWCYYEKAGSTYYYMDGKFINVSTSD